VICKPAHNERVPISSGGGVARIYKVEGFAYTGGGNHINRIELTLDGGSTWKYCFKHYVDKPLRYVFMPFSTAMIAVMLNESAMGRNTGHGSTGMKILSFRNPETQY
jgi:hypothetical protein